MQKLIFKVIFFRIGIKRFEEEVSKNLEDGWKINQLSIEKLGVFRIVCFALLEKPDASCQSV